MYDAVDLASYKSTGTVRINREKFVESCIGKRYMGGVILQRNNNLRL